MWLTEAQLSELCGQLDAVWAEGGGVVGVYTWVEHLRDAAAACLGSPPRVELSGGRSYGGSGGLDLRAVPSRMPVQQTLTALLQCAPSASPLRGVRLLGLRSPRRHGCVCDFRRL
jgi:hypothetical protein